MSSLNATDPDVGDTLTYSVSSPSSQGGTITITDAATGKATYTHKPGYAGPDSFTFKATDNNNLVSNAATVSATVINRPPVASNQQISVTPSNGDGTFGYQTIIPLQATNPDPNDKLTLYIVDPPSKTLGKLVGYDTGTKKVTSVDNKVTFSCYKSNIIISDFILPETHLLSKSGTKITPVVTGGLPPTSTTQAPGSDCLSGEATFKAVDENNAVSNVAKVTITVNQPATSLASPLLQQTKKHLPLTRIHQLPLHLQEVEVLETALPAQIQGTGPSHGTLGTY